MRWLLVLVAVMFLVLCSRNRNGKIILINIVMSFYSRIVSTDVLVIVVFYSVIAAIAVIKAVIVDLYSYSLCMLYLLYLRLCSSYSLYV